MTRLGPRSAPALVLGAVLLSGLAGCGDGSADDTAADTAANPASPVTSTASAQPPPTPTAPPAGYPTDSQTSGGGDGSPGPGEVDADGVTIVSQTAAGGTVSATAVALADDEAVQMFGAQFEGPGLADKISRVVARTDVPVGQALYGAVVAVGCDVPVGVVVTDSDTGVLVSARPIKSPAIECFAPVTSVALLLVDDR